MSDDVSKPGASAARTGAGDGSSLSPSGVRGHTSIAVNVVEKIAGMAARDVSGIYALGSGSRGFGAVREVCDWILATRALLQLPTDMEASV